MENESNTNMPAWKKKVQTAGLLFILVILPLGSWYYLSSGLNYQKSARAELKDYGQVPAFSWVNQDNKIINQDSLLGNMVLVSFFRLDDPENTQRFTVLQALHEQFDDRANVLFAQHSIRPVPDAANTLKAFGKAIKFEDEGQCLYLSGSIEQIHQLLADGYRLPQKGLPKDDNGLIQLEKELPQGLKDYPYFVLVDEKGTIRNYYDYREKGEMKRLVEHMALVMPRE